MRRHPRSRSRRPDIPLEPVCPDGFYRLLVGLIRFSPPQWVERDTLSPCHRATVRHLRFGRVLNHAVASVSLFPPATTRSDLDLPAARRRLPGCARGCSVAED